jgi:hypothetical protein
VQAQVELVHGMLGYIHEWYLKNLRDVPRAPQRREEGNPVTSENSEYSKINSSQIYIYCHTLNFGTGCAPSTLLSKTCPLCELLRSLPGALPFAEKRGARIRLRCTSSIVYHSRHCS